MLRLWVYKERAMLKFGKRNQKGLTSIDYMISIAGIAAMVVYFSGKSESTQLKTDEQVYFDTFNHIVEAARNAKSGTTDGYASITMTTLSSGKFISSTYGDGTGKNPDGGDWNLTGSSISQLVVNATGVNDELCDRLAAKFNKWSTASCSDNTVSITTN